MKINNIRLLDFIMVFVHPSTSMMQFNIVNTDNDSFPQKYRSKAINISSLFRDIMENNDEYLLEKNIDYVSILPVNHKITDTNFKVGMKYDFDHGFFEIKQDPDMGELYREPVAGILHIVLVTD